MRDPTSYILHLNDELHNHIHCTYITIKITTLQSNRHISYNPIWNSAYYYDTTLPLRRPTTTPYYNAVPTTTPALRQQSYVTYVVTVNRSSVEISEQCRVRGHTHASRPRSRVVSLRATPICRRRSIRAAAASRMVLVRMGEAGTSFFLFSPNGSLCPYSYINRFHKRAKGPRAGDPLWLWLWF